MGVSIVSYCVQLNSGGGQAIDVPGDNKTEDRMEWNTTLGDFHGFFSVKCIV